MPKKTKTFSYSEYYQKKKEDIQKKKRERYLKDPLYKEKMRANASLHYAKKKGVDSVEKVSAGVYRINGVDFYSVNYIAQRAGVSGQLVNYYLLNRVIPEPRKIAAYSKRLFSFDYMEAVVVAIDKYKTGQIPRITDISQVLKEILGNKYEETIHHATYK